MKNLIFIAFLVISNSLFGQDIAITVTGSWNQTIAPSDIFEAGNDYPATYTSNASQTQLTINPTSNGKTIYVYVTKSDIKWHGNLVLKVKRTSTGSNNNVTGGSIYQTITDAPSPSSAPSSLTPFFTCKGGVVEMNLQYEITGISVLLPVDAYSTTITYTVMH